MSTAEILEAIRDPGDKEKVLSLLPLLSKPNEIKDSSYHNSTLLHYAARNGWTDVCQILIEQYQVDPHCRTSGGWTALHWACLRDLIDVVKYLVIAVCCDPLSKNDYGQTPLDDSRGETKKFLEGIIG